MMKENKNLIRQAASEAMCSAQMGSERLVAAVSELPQRAKTFLLAGLVMGTLAIESSAAFAAGKGGSEAANVLVMIMQRLAEFFMVLGGGLALLFFALGAIRIITAVDGDQKKKGMENIKNAIIGLVVLVGAFFIRFVVVNLIGSAVDASGQDSGDVGVQ